MSENSVSKNVERAIHILDFFRDRTELGITDLATLMGVHKSVVHRTVNTLTRYGYLERDPKTKNYKLGLVFLEWGNIVAERFPLKNVARPYLEQLTKKTEETSVLSVILDREILCIDKVDADLPIKISLEVGHRHVIYAGASAKAIFAFLPEEKKRSLLAGLNLIEFTERTITDMDRLMEELNEIQSRGYAIAKGEVNSILCSVAAPIFSSSGQLAGAVGIAGLKERFGPEKLPFFIASVLEASRNISNKLGYMGKWK